MTVGHYLFRFGKTNQDYAAPWAGLKQPLMIELSVLRDRKLPQVHAKFSWIQDAVEQLTLCKYKGRTHYGKNFDRTYMHPDCPLRDNLYDFPGLLAMQAKHDPEKVFEPPLMTKMIARAANPLFPKCALMKECYCQEDVHCGDGFACVPSSAFPEYKACRPKDLKALFG